MTSHFQIRCRKANKGPEAELVKKFLDFIEIFYNEKFQYTVLIEPYAEAGIPDVLIIEWNQKDLKNWVPQRNNLVKEDIKIMHHVSSFGNRGVKVEKLSNQLGYKMNQVMRSLEKLVDAHLISIEAERAFIKDLSNNFFINKIITIEVKLRDWKKALYQAELNENFASHSYVLLPHSYINERITNSFQGNVGLLAQNENNVVFKKHAKKGKLPRSYFSWILNEYIGRQEYALI